MPILRIFRKVDNSRCVKIFIKVLVITISGLKQLKKGYWINQWCLNKHKVDLIKGLITIYVMKDMEEVRSPAITILLKKSCQLMNKLIKIRFNF